jgi:pimeloyl-ACP methyl ester carboxylesterase
MNAPVYVPHVEASAPEIPGFWQTLGRGLVDGARRVGAGFSAAFHAVDPDARRDIAQMPLLALTVLGPRHAPIRAQSDDGARPIVYVHGLGGHRGNFLPMRSWLWPRGRRRAYAVGLPGDGDLVDLGRHLGDVIREVIAVNDLPDDAQVDIVAHSMGGVIARLAITELAIAARVHTLVTLGTPHAGTHSARFAGTIRCQDLRPDSPVTMTLRAQEPWSGGPRLVAFWSRSDPLMQPAETARVEGADNREVPGTTHIEYMLSRDVWAEVLDALEAD